MVSSAKTREAKKAKKAEEAAEQARIALEASKKDAPDPPLDGEESQEDKDPGSPDDKDSNSDSDDGVEDTTPSVIPKPPAGHKGATASSKKRSGASSSSKKNKKPKTTKGSLLVPSLKLFSGFPPKGAADPIRDKAVSKALAVQATYVPKIPPAVVKDLLTNPALTFVLFESLLTGLDHRLWMKALVDNLPVGALLPAQVTAITDGL